MATVIKATTRAALALQVAALSAAVLWSAPARAQEESPSGDQCLSAPQPQPGESGHWHYRLDRANQRKCWYLAQPSERAHQAEAKPHDVAAHGRHAAAGDVGDEPAPAPAAAAPATAGAPAAVAPIAAAPDADAPPAASAAPAAANAASAPAAMTAAPPAVPWPDPPVQAAPAPAASLAPAAPAASPASTGTTDPGMSDPATQDQAGDASAATESPAPAPAAPAAASDSVPGSILRIAFPFGGALLAAALIAQLVAKISAARQRRAYFERRAQHSMRMANDDFRAAPARGRLPDDFRHDPFGDAYPTASRDITQGLLPHGTTALRPRSAREFTQSRRANPS